MPEFIAQDEAGTRKVGAELAPQLQPGDVVLLEGPLGAGKTTLARGIIEALGHHGQVRSPTFNLVQVFDTSPPVMHADLYRVGSHEGIGIEDYLETHICLIEWPDRSEGLFKPGSAWRVRITFLDQGRLIVLEPPTA